MDGRVEGAKLRQEVWFGITSCVDLFVRSFDHPLAPNLTVVKC